MSTNPTIDPLDELALYLRPPGQGIHAVSTGKRTLEEQTRAYLGPTWDPHGSWREAIEVALRARVAVLAIPSDAGAGIVRGAAWGPPAIRAGLVEIGLHPADLGDVFCIPHFIDDEMCSPAQLARSREALYGDLMPELSRTLPVSPISIARRVIALVRALAPELRLFILGGDHTVTIAPMTELLAEDPAANADIGIVHFDAHTDLLEERLGVRHCFATWAWHANERLGRGGRLVQIGIRASARDKAHWEATANVRQIWAKEARTREPEALAREVVHHLEHRGVRRIYVSNDIDGTDARFAAACGTPEPDGLLPEHVVATIEALRGRFLPIGADLVELAPVLGSDDSARKTSVETATRYARSTLDLLAWE